MTRRELSALTLAIGPALAALALATGGSAMTSPRLIEPSEMAGEWTLRWEGGGACRIRLTDTPVAGTGGYAVDLGDCSQLSPALAAVTNWRGSTDGIALAEADRSTVMFLSRHGDALLKTGGQSALKTGGVWTMTR
ncbi:MAG TPA: AprI/Inh family metalloprotease inhibitor [Caulobacteraceae bacterium]|jgi:hypothetical protein